MFVKLWTEGGGGINVIKLYVTNNYYTNVILYMRFSLEGKLTEKHSVLRQINHNKKLNWSRDITISSKCPFDDNSVSGCLIHVSSVSAILIAR